MSMINYEIYVQYQINDSDEVLIKHGKIVDDQVQKKDFISKITDIVKTTPIYKNNNGFLYERHNTYVIKILTTIRDSANRTIPLLIFVESKERDKLNLSTLRENSINLLSELKELEAAINKDVDIKIPLESLITGAITTRNDRSISTKLKNIAKAIIAKFIGINEKLKKFFQRKHNEKI